MDSARYFCVGLTWFAAADHRSLLYRLYRDGYRPVRYDKRTFWCRHDPISTGTNLKDQVRCENHSQIEVELSSTNFPL